MYQVMKNIKSIKGRLKYISDVLCVAVENIEENASKEVIQEITEPFVEMLIGCSEGVNETVVLESKNTRIGEEVIEQLKLENKIVAIKLFKQEFDTSLKDAKNEIERIYECGKILVQEWEYDGKVLWKENNK